MIILDQVTKVVPQRGELLSAVSAELPSNRRLAILALDKTDQYNFLRLIAGIALPTRGSIVRRARVSFPVGHAGGIWPEISVRQNVAYVARLYGASVPEVLRFVQEVTRLGPKFDRPYMELDRPTRALINLVIAYSIPFDTYLIDQSVARGDSDMRAISATLFKARMQTSGAIITTRQVETARQYCDMAAVLHNGRLTLFEDLERGIDIFNKVKAAATQQPQPE